MFSMVSTTEVRRNLAVSIALIVLIFTLGVAVYHTVEGWSVLNSIYFISMTITTVGYGDVVPETELGKLFTVILVWVGISVAFFLIYSISAYREHKVDKHVIGRLTMLRNLALTRRGARKNSTDKVRKLMTGK